MLRTLILCVIVSAGAFTVAGCGGDPEGYGKPGDSTLPDATPFDTGANTQTLPERK